MIEWRGPIVAGQGISNSATSPITQSERMYCAAKYKRLEAGVFQLPVPTEGEQGIELDCSQLRRLLGGLDLKHGRRRKRYRRVG